MNLIFFLLVLISFCWAAVNQLSFTPTADLDSPMQLLGSAMISGAQDAVSLAIGLVGVMSLFLGLVKIAEAGGLMKIIAKALRPLLIRLFPDVPPDHPAMGSMIMNLSANALGLANAATPFGIKAMQDLDKLNSEKGTATNAMILFLAINTSSVTLLPTGVIALRAAAGSLDPAAILPTTLFASTLSTAVAIVSAKLLSPMFRGPKPLSSLNFESANQDSYPLWISALSLLTLFSLIPIAIVYGSAFSPWILPSLMLFFLLFGVIKGVSVYETFIEGAKDGFNVALKIIPYLVAILTSVSMLRASGALEAFVSFIGQWTGAWGLPAEALPMALLRPLSGSGAYGILAATINDPSIGPDSYVGLLVSTIQGSTETTFYVLAVYFGAVQIKRIRHAIPCALAADTAGVIGAVLAVNYLF
ncbi:MAG: spore maturation protein [Legionellales bacterium]|nr:spore maturation protein [Legionellales bacterium]